MDIPEIIAGAMMTAKNKEELKYVLRFPRVCNILLYNYQSILLLKPAQKHHKINVTQLTTILTTSFSKLGIELSLEKDDRLSAATLRMCCVIRLRLIRDFEVFGEKLNEKMKAAAGNYCAQPIVGEGELIKLFYEKIKSSSEVSVAENPGADQLSPNRLMFRYPSILLFAVSLLNESHWFVESDSDPLFSSQQPPERLHVGPKKIKYVALFLRKAKKAGLIEAEFGTGYMEEAARRLIYNDEDVKATTLNNLCNALLNHPGVNDKLIIMEVTAMIEKIVKEKNKLSKRHIFSAAQ